MKKAIVALALLFLLICLPSGIFAATATASITGPAVCRAGESLSVDVVVNASGIYAAQGNLVFDSGLLSYTGSTNKLAGWAVDLEASSGQIRFLAIDDQLAAPINGSRRLFTLTFTVNAGVSVGTLVQVVGTGLGVSDGSADSSIGDATFAASVIAPPSSNNNLRSMVVSNATFTPSFSAGTTSYTAEVPFAVAKLNLTASAEDGGARVSISNPELAVGGNTVSVTVTAANGAVKKYTISVTRAQDPDYEPSGNANLSALEPEVGILSPPFDPDRTEYVLYLPYEILSFLAGGTPEDANATVQSELIALKPGANQDEITVKAENGTEKVYEITVHRMPAIGTSPTTVKPTVVPSPTKAPTPSPTQPATPTPTTAPPVLPPADNGISAGATIAIGVACLLVGAGATWGILQWIRKRRSI
ncbi:MAG: hypothetical protein GX153_03180 [Clostridiaceae bacterium]|nr:hypothetical protein [Clostridiaceae bacterium]